MQVEMIKWLAISNYVDTLIDNDMYLVQDIYGEIDRAFWVNKDWDNTMLNPADIISFAELPKPCDPTAKQFNFWTALEMMKNGVLCRSMVSGKHIRIPNNYNGFIEDDGEFNSDHYIVLAEIEGLWERADAD